LLGYPAQEGQNVQRHIQEPQLASPATEETSQLIASDKVEGTAVYNRNGDRLGSVYNFMVNKRSGQVAYVWRLSWNRQQLPSATWNELTYDTSLGGYVVNRTREQLEGAPAYSASELQSWDDAVYSGRVDDYYNGLGGGRMAQP
jgi:hypothetical protein